MELGGVGRPREMPERLVTALPSVPVTFAALLGLPSLTRGLPAARAWEMLEILEAMGSCWTLIAAEILTDCVMPADESVQNPLDILIDDDVMEEPRT